ncbi:MAG: vacuolar-type H(+)-translocating pyrophosphatase, partial [Parcubacteria group bacterium Gr01-1014_66]
MHMLPYLLFPIFCGLIAIGWAILLKYRISLYPTGAGTQVMIWRAIQEGARAYLWRQHYSVSLVALPLMGVMWWGFGTLSAAGFLLGACASALAGHLGMMVAADTNVRTTEAAKIGLSSAFRVAFSGGSVTGFLVVGLALGAVSIFYAVVQEVEPLIGLAFGSSLISLFARLGGGIFTKGADVGADLVGKLEQGIPEDDPRNPAVIADNVGDNVGDCAGMAADLFETYAVTSIAAMLLGSLIFPDNRLVILLPLLMGGVAIIASLLGSLFVRVKEKDKIMRGFYRGLVAASILMMAGLLPLLWIAVPAQYVRPFFVASATGIVVMALMVVITEYYTSKKFRPVREIARASLTGHGTNVIMGLAFSMEATALPVILISSGILVAFFAAQIYGVALAAMAMLSMAGIIIAIDAFGPITDNAGGIAEMAGLPERVRAVTDPLDAIGNTTKAVTKGYAIASAGLATLVLFASYVEELQHSGKVVFFDIANPYVLVGILIGAMMPYLFASLAMRAVGKAAQGVVEEVRRQFREIKGIMEGTGKPQYDKAVDIVTRYAIRQMIVPALIPIVIPITLVVLTGAHALEALGGLLIG